MKGSFKRDFAVFRKKMLSSISFWFAYSFARFRLSGRRGRFHQWRHEIRFGILSIALLGALPFVSMVLPIQDFVGLGQPESSLASISGIEDIDVEKAGLSYRSYTVVSGDTVSGIAHSFGLNQDTIISVNDIQKARALQIGMVLQIPNMDGVLHKVKEGESVEKIAGAYTVEASSISEINKLEPEAILAVDQSLFVPNARLPNTELRRIQGELFRMPARGWISSRYGYRTDPIAGGRSFHTGIDIANSFNTPVVAAMDGRVKTISYSERSGNYVLISHAGGYTTMYAHLNTVAVRSGQRVTEGQKIGTMGSTGYSTGSHLHFTVYRWGRTVNPLLLLR